MIIEKYPLSVAESLEFVDKDSDVANFMKKFKGINTKDSKDIRKKLEGLDLIKMREEHVVKIIDILPDNSEELNKIFTDSSLDEDESNKILDVVKQYK